MKIIEVSNSPKESKMTYTQILYKFGFTIGIKSLKNKEIDDYAAYCKANEIDFTEYLTKSCEMFDELKAEKNISFKFPHPRLLTQDWFKEEIYIGEELSVSPMKKVDSYLLRITATAVLSNNKKALIDILRTENVSKKDSIDAIEEAGKMLNKDVSGFVAYIKGVY